MKKNRDDIKQILPHREPLLLVDEVIHMNPTEIEASLYIDPDMDILAGHFPDHPILPGIYIIEALAQTADLLLLSLPGNEGRIPYFSSVVQMRFLRPASPGDTLTLKAVLTACADHGLYECRVTALHQGKKIASGILSLTLK